VGRSNVPTWNSVDAMESEFLDKFWKLSSIDEGERLQAAKDILQLLGGFRVSVGE